MFCIYSFVTDNFFPFIVATKPVVVRCVKYLCVNDNVVFEELFLVRAMLEIVPRKALQDLLYAFVILLEFMLT